MARYYRGHPDYAGEVDHAALASLLETYDGWALSTSAAALPAVLRHFRADVRVASWVRGARPGIVSRGPRNAWEPVIYRHARPVVLDVPCEDALIHGVRPRTSEPSRVIGAKPAPFAFWLFQLIGARAGDSLDDLYPGSGGISRAWTMAGGRS